jgi:hypothetical protein
VDLAGGTALIIRRLMVPLAVAFVTAYAGQGLAQSAFPAPLPGQAGSRNDPAFPPVPGQAGTRNDPAFPPVPGQAGTRNDPAFPPVSGRTVTRNDPAFPPVNGGASGAFPAGGAAPILGGGFTSGPASPTMQSGGPSEACMKNFMPLREEAEKRGKLIKVASEHHASPEEACKLIENFSQAEIRMMRYVEANATKCGIPPQIHAQLEKGHSNTEMMQKKVCTMAQQRPAGPSLSEALGSAVALPEATPKKKGGSAFDTLTGNVLTR